MEVIELFLVSHSKEYHVAYTKYTHTIHKVIILPF